MPPSICSHWYICGNDIESVSSLVGTWIMMSLTIRLTWLLRCGYG